MRFYCLSLYGNSQLKGEPLLKFQSGLPFPRHNNWTPLQIEFEKNANIQDADGGSGVNFWINLHSQSLNTFVALQSWLENPSQLPALVKNEKGSGSASGIFIKFECGFNYQNPIIQKLGYIKPASNVLYIGSLYSVTGNFTQKESFIHLSWGQGASDLSPYVGNTFKISRGEKLFGSGEVNFDEKNNAMYSNTIIAMLDLYYKGKTYYIHPDLKDVTWDRDETKIIKLGDKLETFSSQRAKLLNTLKKEFGLYVVEDDTGVYILPSARMKLIEIEPKYGERPSYMTAAFISGQRQELLNQCKRGEVKRETTNAGYVRKLAHSEIIGYPVFGGFNQGFNLTTVLRPDIKIANTVELPDNVMLASLGASLREGFNASNQAGKLSTTLRGKYLVAGVQHRGNFYGKGAENWATQLWLVNQEQWKMFRGDKKE